jgi:protein TonB
MLERLPASDARRSRRPGVVVASTALHALVIGLAVRSSGWSAPTPIAPTPERPILWVAPRAPEPHPAQPTVGPPRNGATSPSAVPTVVPPLVSGIELPPMGRPLGPVLADPFSDARGHVADEEVYRAGPQSGHGSGALGPVLDENAVDRVVVPLPGGRTPRYPEILRAAGVEGQVTLRFVVDTTGRVEPGSMRAVEATHPLFLRAVEDAVATTRFAPAEARGRRVRQLVERTFKFQLEGARR